MEPNNSESMLYSSKLEAISAVALSSSLTDLEKRLQRFNIFEALGAVRAELRHSDFLAFLLDPQQSHNLGAAFLQYLLQEILVLSSGTRFNVIPDDLAQWSLTGVTVRREWRHIDILILDNAGEWAIIIENKIDADERPGQLEEYYEAVRQYYPGRTIIAIFLTKDGRSPKNPNSPFMPLDYRVVSEVLERVRVVSEQAQHGDTHALIAIAHYIGMLRRYVVSDSDIAQLCRKIYAEHQRALDLIYQHRPMPHLSIKDALKAMVQEDAKFKLEVDRSSRYMMMTVREWGKLPALQLSGRCALVYVFGFSDSHIQLSLQIGPFRPKEESSLRRRLLDMAASHRPPFHPPQETGSPQYTSIYTADFLERSPVSLEPQEVEEIRRKWSDLLAADGDFFAISSIVEAQDWLRQDSDH